MTSLDLLASRAGIEDAYLTAAGNLRRTSAGTQLQQGGIIDVETFIDVSNVQIVCRACGRPTRVGHRTDEDGIKSRICRRCDAEL